MNKDNYVKGLPALVLFFIIIIIMLNIGFSLLK